MKHRFRSGILAAALGLGLLAGQAGAATMVYVSNADSKDIYVLTLDNRSGAVKLVEKVPVTGTVMPLAISPNHRYLYASLRSEPFSVSSFAIDQATGRLGLLSTVPLPDNMAYLSTDKTGRLLFGASYTGDKISVNPIGPQGFVQPQPIDVIPTRKNAHSIVTDPSNHYVFASNLGGDIILQYKLDPVSGHLTANGTPFVETKQGAGPRHILFHPNGRLVYATNELDGTVNTYKFDPAAGTLTLIASTSAMPDGFTGGKPWTSDLHITPDGRFLYVAERTSSTLAGFRIDGETGALTPIAHTQTEAQPRGFNIDPRGHFLLAVGQKSNGMSVYAINGDTGALTSLGHHEMGKNPNWVEILDIP
ncbi:6-phosphogluconolactonase [Aliidongia dinghuensis]|uniref:6-phosphogluconolactonase n=1 Tax=Aliidongia dinghuensis TaxID=1867774 RepID=A0A8J2YRN9_9PROT|nr:beta-propeller fold lactonase family protein [Aliidongia dinghuensis]GGF10367.1 6-phosphogluconolactonase [Aliidongia dinghuensis]